MKMRFDNFQQMYRFSRGQNFREPGKYIEPKEEPEVVPQETEEEPKPKKRRKKKETQE